MKKFLSLVLLLSVFVCAFGVPVSAIEVNDKLVSRSVEYLENGDYFVTELYQPVIQPFTGTNGYKTSTYTTAYGSRVFSVTVYGTFTYNGTSSSATSATASVDIYDSSASFVSKNAYTSGISAIATGTARYLGNNITRSVSLSCDKNGNLY